MRMDEQVVRHGGALPADGWSRGFPGEEASVPAARAWVRELLATRIAATALDDVLLLLSEVVTNAVAHSDSGCVVDGLVTVRVARVSEAVHVEVTDAGSATCAPVARVAEPDSDGGRGLWLVNQIATAWGSSCPDGGAGRSVWFQVSLAFSDDRMQ
ncbi:ATP-binding protein [Sphaerisporangium perillae]|uniref:ATP-binding protein n=1 Tax=Sphaerisporangium perillae TaxID=2935860 RepID=UPI00200E1A03|nr:ATP-binding protein [Sphaerisporangium perillae]